MSVTVVGAKKILEAYFGATALHAAMDHNGAELSSASNYARVSVAATVWTITEEGSSNRAKAITNANVTFPTADAVYASGQIPTHISLYDAAANGNQIIRDSVSVSAVGSGERVRIPTGSMSVYLTVA